MQDIIYPFTRKQNKALIYSWGLCLPKGVEQRLGYKELCLLAKHLKLSPNTLVARFEEGTSDPYLTFSRDGSHYIVRRSEVTHGYLGISFDPSWRKDLTTLETILIAAIACYSLQNQLPLTYGQMAARTGYSRRQVIRHVGILADKGYLVPCMVGEEITINTKKGSLDKQRERASHTLSPSFQERYLRYLKNITPEDIKLKPGNIKNITDFRGKSDFAQRGEKLALPGQGEKGKTSSQGNTPLKAAWDIYKTTFTPGPSESLRGVETLIRQGKLKAAHTDKLIKAIQKAKSIPFLKVANGFGWKEAVVECYQRKALAIGASSHHIEKFSSAKLTFAWIIGHADEILLGKYDEAPITQKQKAFASGFTQRSSQNIKKTLYKSPPKVIIDKKALSQEIKDSYEGEEQKARLYLLEKLSSSFYQSWLQEMPIKAENDKIIIYAQNPFKAGYLEKKFYTYNRIEIITNASYYPTTYTSGYSSERFLHETSLKGQSARHKGSLFPPSHETKKDPYVHLKAGCPTFFKEEDGRGHSVTIGQTHQEERIRHE